MRDTDFYGQVLGLVEPWEVIGVEFDVAERKVEVSIGYAEGALWECPESGEPLACHDHVERRWRHLDSCQNVSAAGRLVGLSWDRLHRLMERAVERGMECRDMQGAVHLGLDEKSFARDRATSR